MIICVKDWHNFKQLMLIWSGKLGVRGKVDEIHLLRTNEKVPLIIIAEYDDRIYKTYKTQMVLYGLLIEEMFANVVNRGFLVYCRGEIS